MAEQAARGQKRRAAKTVQKKKAPSRAKRAKSGSQLRVGKVELCNLFKNADKTGGDPV